MYIGDYLARRELYSPEQLAILDYGKQPVLTLTYRADQCTCQPVCQLAAFKSRNFHRRAGRDIGQGRG
jgi:hypothetical protein